MPTKKARKPSSTLRLDEPTMSVLSAAARVINEQLGAKFSAVDVARFALAQGLPALLEQNVDTKKGIGHIASRMASRYVVSALLDINTLRTIRALTTVDVKEQKLYEAWLKTFEDKIGTLS